MSDAERRAALLRSAVGRSGPVAPAVDTFLDWQALAERERIVPLLYGTVDRVATDLGDDEREAIRALQEAAMFRCVRIEHHAAEVWSLLDANGILCAALKGLATAHLDYPSPEWREFSDVDLLVSPEDHLRSIELLRAEGWVQAYALPRGHGEFTHAVTLSRRGVELDLHQRIAHRALGLHIATVELLSRGEPIRAPGFDARALDALDRTVHAAVHVTTSRGANRKLSSVADVLVLANRSAPLAAEVLSRAERWRVRSIVEHAVLEAHVLASLDLPAGWADAIRRPVRSRDRIVDWAYLGDTRRPATEELAYLRLMDGWDTRGRYLRGYFATDPEYAAQHGRRGFVAQARYLAAKLRGRA